MKEDQLRVLLVDDEWSLREPLAKRLRDGYGYDVDPAANADEAWKLIAVADRPYDVVLIDDLLAPEPEAEPEPIGIELMERIRQHCPKTEYIVFTGWGMERALAALQAGAYRYLAKPLNLDELGMTIRMAAEQARLRRERDLLSTALAISNVMVRQVDVDRTLEVIVDAVPKLVGAEACTVARMDPTTSRVEHGPGVQLGDTSVQWRQHLKNGALTRQIIEDGQTYTMADVDAHTDEVDENLHRARVKSFIGVPIPGEPENWGVLYAYSTRQQAFGPHEQRVLQLLAGQAGIALENAQLFETEARRRQEADALRETALTINSSLELDETLKRTCQAAVEFFNADHSGLVLFDSDYAHGRVKAEYPLKVTLGRIIPVRGVPAEERLIETKEPLVISDVADDASSLRLVLDIFQEFDIQSILIVPVVGKNGDVIGSFSLDAIGRRRQFTGAEVELCRVFAAHVAVAVEHARLYQEAKEGRAYIKSLYEASNTRISPREPKQVLKDIVESARVAANAAWASVILVDEMGQARTLVTAGTEKEFDVTKVMRPNGLTMQVMRTGVAVVIEDTIQQRDRVNPSMFRDGIAAALCLPFSSHGKRIGVMWIHYDQPRHFREFEIEALQLYVNQAAVAFDTARRLEELEHMRQASESLASAVSLQEVLEQIVRSARKVLRADSTAIWPYDDVLDKFIMQSSVTDGIPADLWEEFRKAEPQRGQTADTVMERGGLVVEDVADEQQYLFLRGSTRKLLGQIGVQSFQGIALVVGQEKLGVLYVNYDRPRRFSDEEQETARTFAYHASLALKNARLLAQMQRTQEATKVIAGVTVQEDLNRTLETIARHAQRVLCSDAVTLYSYNEATGRFSEWTAEIADARAPDSARPPDNLTDDSVAWSILNLTESPYYHLAEDHASRDGLLGGHFVEVEGIRAAIGIQLRVSERKMGVMFVNFRSPHRFTSGEVATVQLFADQAAVAIRNAQLYRDLQQQYEALKRTKGLVNSRTALAWMGMTSSAWRHSIDKHAVTIRDQTRLLHKDLNKVQLHEQHIRVSERLAKIEHLAGRILKKPITPPLSAEEGMDSVAVNDLIGERARQLWENAPYKEAELQLDLRLSRLATVRVSPEWLRRAFDILVDNAADAVADRKVQRITIGTQAANGGGEILVADTGPGIPEEIRAKIGLEFIEKPEDARGVGMGLLMAQTIVQAYGGNIRVDDTGPTGTTMVIWLPLEEE